MANEFNVQRNSLTSYVNAKANTFCEASIVGSEIIRGKLLEREHVEYIVQVRIGCSDFEEAVATWKVKRRFNQFEKLDKLLRDTLARDERSSLPNLPTKALIRSLASEYIAQKQVELEEYLAGILSHPAAMNTPETCAFFTGTLLELADNLGHAFASASEKKFALNDELAKLSFEKSESDRIAAQAEAQRNVAITQLQAARRQLANAASKSPVDDDIIVKSKSIMVKSPVHRTQSSSFEEDASKSSTDVAQIEVLKMCIDSLEQDKSALLNQVKQLQSEKKLLIKECKAQRTLLSEHNISV